MKLQLRKFTKFVDKTFIEGGKNAKEPVLLVSVAAVIENPWAGRGFVEDIKPEILELAPKIGNILVPELIKERDSCCNRWCSIWKSACKNWRQISRYERNGH